MRPIRTLSLVFALMLLTAVAARAEDAAKFEGRWKMIKAEIAGQDVTGMLMGFVLEIKEGRYTVTQGDQKLDEGKIAIDASAEPAKVDISPEKEGSPAKILGIGRIVDGKATFVLRIMGEQRPTKFESDPNDTSIMVATYERVQ